MGTSHEDFSHLWQYLGKFFRMRNTLDKICGENQNTFYTQ